MEEPKAFCFLIHTVHGSNRNPVKSTQTMTVFATNKTEARYKAVHFYEGNGIVKIQQMGE